MYELRREQMKMQQESLEAKLRTGLKERQFFYPATFETLEAILRSNFTSVPNLEVVEGEDHSRPQTSRVQEVKFYADSDLANEAFEGENFFAVKLVIFFQKHDWKTFSLKALENDFETDF